jgi:hypothetical protein
VLVCSRTDICVCIGERSGDIELSSLEAQLSDDALLDDSANDSANDQLTVPQPVGTLSGACPFVSLSCVFCVVCYESFGSAVPLERYCVNGVPTRSCQMTATAVSAPPRGHTAHCSYQRLLFVLLLRCVVYRRRQTFGSVRCCRSF